MQSLTTMFAPRTLSFTGALPPPTPDIDFSVVDAWINLQEQEDMQFPKEQPIIVTVAPVIVAAPAPAPVVQAEPSSPQLVYLSAMVEAMKHAPPAVDTDVDMKESTEVAAPPSVAPPSVVPPPPSAEKIASLAHDSPVVRELSEAIRVNEPEMAKHLAVVPTTVAPAAKPFRAAPGAEEDFELALFEGVVVLARNENQEWTTIDSITSPTKGPYALRLGQLRRFAQIAGEANFCDAYFTVYTWLINRHPDRLPMRPYFTKSGETKTRNTNKVDVQFSDHWRAIHDKALERFADFRTSLIGADLNDDTAELQLTSTKDKLNPKRFGLERKDGIWYIISTWGEERSLVNHTRVSKAKPKSNDKAAAPKKLLLKRKVTAEPPSSSSSSSSSASSSSDNDLEDGEIPNAPPSIAAKTLAHVARTTPEVIHIEDDVSENGSVRASKRHAIELPAAVGGNGYRVVIDVTSQGVKIRAEKL